MRPWPTLRPLSPSARDKMRRARSQSLRQPRPSPPSPRPPRRSAQPRRLRQRRPRGARRPPRHGLLRTCRARRCRRRAWAPARCRASRRRCPRCASGAQTLCYPTSGVCRLVPRLGAGLPQCCEDAPAKLCERRGHLPRLMCLSERQLGNLGMHSFARAQGRGAPACLQWGGLQSAPASAAQGLCRDTHPLLLHRWARARWAPR